MVCSSQVRQSGQRILGKGLSVFAFSYRTLLDGVTRYLTNDDDVEHHQYKVRPVAVLSARSILQLHKST